MSKDGKRQSPKFSFTEEMVDDAGSITPTVREEIVAHLEMLSESFDGYFAAGDLKISEEWIINPYSYNMEKMSNDEELKEDLIDLRTNRALEMQFESKTLEEFWCSTGYVPKTWWKSTPCPHSICNNILV